MHKHQPETTNCGYCEGNRQLLNQLLADVGDLKRANAEPRINVIDWRDGDTLILTAQHRMTDQEYEDIADRLQRQFPGRKAMLLEDGMQIGVLRPQDGEAE